MPAGLGEKYWRGGQAGGQAGGRPLPPPRQDQLVSTAPPAGLGRFHASGRGRLPSRDGQLVTVRLPARLGCFGQWRGGDYSLAHPRVDQLVRGGERYVIRPLAGGGQTTRSITTSWLSPTTPWTCGFALPGRRQLPALEKTDCSRGRGNKLPARLG